MNRNGPTSAPLPLALSMGEPGGIGPEIALMAWRALRETGPVFCLVGCAALLHARAQRAGIDAPVQVITDVREAMDTFPRALPVLETQATRNMHDTPGKALPENATAVLAAIDEAARLAAEGLVAGMVTLPIQKESLYKAGFAFEGHTDYLAEVARRLLKLDEPPQTVMMLTAKDLRAIPVTVHIPLKEVPARLSSDSIISQGEIVARDLARWFGVARPRIAVAGLNPHAGEGGRMGTEEDDIIRPAISALQERGIDAFGPLPADTLFHDEARTTYDAVLCMYHDQALIPVKTLDFHGGVNVTLGLPFVRTSPDHGTALTLAGSARARPHSLIAALRTAAGMARHNASAAARP